MNKGKLFLIPIPLGENSGTTIPQYVIDIIHSLDIFIVERARTARRFISTTRPPQSISEMVFHELDKRDPDKDISSFMNEIQNGKNIGLMSEAGCPGIADPGALVVGYAHNNEIEVVPLVGPSSILLALIASGMNGQDFHFHGYLPVKPPERVKALKKIESISASTGSTRIFMETPYRNMALIEDMLKHLSPKTRLCIATDLTLPTQYIRTKTIIQWKRNKPVDLHKRPTVFVLNAR